MNPKSLIQRNAREIADLHRRVHESFRQRDGGPAERAAWTSACEDFHSRYEPLAFPGGTRSVRERLRACDTFAIEYALCFIEVRPYFFRSGYMYNDFLRVLKNCDLTELQRLRYDRVRDAYLAYRRRRRELQDGG